MVAAKPGPAFTFHVSNAGTDRDVLVAFQQADPFHSLTAQRWLPLVYASLKKD
jgi:hypothetical protein